MPPTFEEATMPQTSIPHIIETTSTVINQTDYVRPDPNTG